MLKLGSSRPWQEAMQQISGQTKMDAQALMDYFKPLTDWLVEQNRGQDISWDETCPYGTFEGMTTPTPTDTTPMSGAPSQTCTCLYMLISLLLINLLRI